MLVERRGKPPVEIVEFPREVFLRDYWHYRPGEHVTILAPTDYGKTTLTFQLLEHTARPELPVVNFALKPRDRVLQEESRRLGYRLTRTWPPTLMWLHKPNGWTLWPTMSADPDADDERLAHMIRGALLWIYRYAPKSRRAGMIVNADEMEEIQRLLAVINKQAMLRGLYRRMRSNGGGMWAGCQAPKWLVTDAYGQAQHLFLGNDPEERNRQRFGEIGGVDARLVESAVEQLADRQWLYLRRRGRVMCAIT